MEKVLCSLMQNNVESMIEIEISQKDCFRQESSMDTKFSHKKQNIYIVLKYLPIRKNGKIVTLYWRTTEHLPVMNKLTSCVS